MTDRLRPGDEAPDFTLPDQDGHPFHLAESLQRRKSMHLIYFYPKADTPAHNAGLRPQRRAPVCRYDGGPGHQPRPAEAAGRIRYQIRPRVPTVGRRGPRRRRGLRRMGAAEHVRSW